ncbi:MAG: FAD-binding protein [Thermoplasmata archaeon]|nr:FAD-binding protein [Thermoplasmata archaeon]
MQTAVLAKVVPNLEHLRFDPECRTMIRDGTEQFINPFDQRALRVALELRRPGETVSVVSMGPPGAEAALRDALALGADRVLLVSDPMLAGSDTLVTARVLARALSLVGHDLVLAGAWTTDSETGQVGPEVAGLLGVPVVTQARKLTREDPGSLFVRSDTDDGWADYLLQSPALVTVGEKIAKPRRPTPDELSAAGSRSVEIVRATQLGLSGASVGLSGSPTVVSTLANEEPGRSPKRFQDGPVESRVAQAVEALRPLLSTAVEPEPSGGEPDGPAKDENELWVLVTGPSGTLSGDALPILSEVRRRLAPLWPSAVWIGPSPTAGDREALARAGALRGAIVPLPPAPVDPEVAALALGTLLDHRPGAAAGAFVASGFGRTVAGLLASREGLGLTGDAVGVERDASGRLIWRKPSFGGGIIAHVYSRTRPSLATVRSGAFRTEPGPTPGEPPGLPWEEIEPPAARSRAVLLGSGRELDERFAEPASADVVVCVGMGIGGPEKIGLVLESTRRMGAALTGTRRVVDAGWLPRQLQVGLTGRSYAPALAILVGVSGSLNHLVGWKRARAVLAINNDPAAPVLERVDVGIVGRWEEVLPPLAEALAPSLGALRNAPG